MSYWSFLGFMKHLDAVLKNAVILKSKHGFLNFGKNGRILPLLYDNIFKGGKTKRVNMWSA